MSRRRRRASRKSARRSGTRRPRATPARAAPAQPSPQRWFAGAARARRAWRVIAALLPRVLLAGAALHVVCCESRYHLACGPRPVAIAAAALLWIGALLGLRREAARDAAGPRHRTGREAARRAWWALEIGWLFVAAAGWRLEHFRTFLTRHFLLPAPALAAAVLTPIAAGLVLAAALSGARFAATHDLRTSDRHRRPDRGSPRLRAAVVLAAGVAAAAAGAVAVVFTPAPRAPLQAPVLPAPSSAAGFIGQARRLVLAEPLEVLRIAPPADPREWMRLVRGADRGPAVDLILFEPSDRAAGAARGAPTTRGKLRRWASRLAARLVRGGRVVIEQPSPLELVAAVRAAARERLRPPPAGYRLRVSDGRRRYEAIVFGGDIPELVRRTAAHTPFDVTLEPLAEEQGRP